MKNLLRHLKTDAETVRASNAFLSIVRANAIGSLGRSWSRELYIYQSLWKYTAKIVLKSYLINRRPCRNTSPKMYTTLVRSLN